jgi:cytochrome c peroxidase
MARLSLNGFPHGALALVIVCGWTHLRATAAPIFEPAEVARILRLSPLPAPTANETNRVADDERAARLGQRLFFDRRLSPDGRFSCATCHDPAKAFTDGRAVGEGRVPLRRNVPSLLDIAQQRWFDWDGSADTLWTQALRPLEHPAEMGGDRVSIARLLASDARLRRDYEQIFGALPTAAELARLPSRARPPILSNVVVAEELPPDQAMEDAWMSIPDADRRRIDAIFANVGKAIEAYERRLQSQPSPFDRFVEALREEAAGGSAAGRDALPPAAQRGLKLFIGTGQCRLCHNGANLSDGEFHSIGIPPRDGGAPVDAGRYEGIRVLGLDPFGSGGAFSDAPRGPRAARVASLARGPESWGQFRTPSLRHVARTAPYMHAGQMGTLEEVIRFYSTHEGRVDAGHHRETILEPLRLDEGQIRDLIAFLESLSGSDPAATWMQPPE